MRLTLWPFHSKGVRARDREMPRRCSSGSWSLTVDPSSTRPSRLMAPARCKSASARLVLPAPPWPTRATLRIFSDEKSCTQFPLASSTAASAGQGSHGTYVVLVVAPSTLRLPDGRTLAFDDIGDPGAPAVVYLHGTPDSRLARPP